MAKFIKDFKLEVEVFKMKNKYKNNLYKYGIIGEERVAHQLRVCTENVLCLHDVRLSFDNETSQYDFVVISRKTLYIIEVKNLLGNIVVKDNGDIERILYKNGQPEKCGLFNPFVQMNEQKRKMETFLCLKGIVKAVKPILIMANDKMLIEKNELFNSVYKYDELNLLLEKEINGEQLLKEDFVLGEKILENIKKYNYLITNVIGRKMMNQYVPVFKENGDKEYYIELISLRKKLMTKYNMPACNIYNNKEAEMLVLFKPQNKLEFLNIKGFKEKRYQMYGEDIIKLFKKK